MDAPFPRNILHVTHPWGGGIQTYLDDMVRMFGDRSRIFFLVSEHGAIHVITAATGKKRSYRFGPPVGLTDYHRSDYRKALAEVIDYLGIDLVHLNSMLGHPYDLIEVAHENDIPLVCTVHDYYFICPTFHMVRSDGTFCEGCSVEQIDAACLVRNEYLGYAEFDPERLADWREEFRNVIPLIGTFVFPSVAAQHLFEEYFPETMGKAVVIMHGDSLPEGAGIQYERGAESDLRVGVIGSLWKHKGRDLVEYIVEHNADDGIVFVHFGDHSISSDKMTKLGRYSQGRIVSLLQEQRIDVILILSTWPETFSYTLSEAIKAEIPAIVTNLGATRERVEALGIGWVVDYRHPRQVLDLLAHLKRNRQEIATRKAILGRVAKTTLDDMMHQYAAVYARLLAGRKQRPSKRTTIALSARLFLRRLALWARTTVAAR
jgi:glycosyltransferase involved in cell wall biosynthesis